jgi:threonine/homoserine/homoserine lactone efflux protein
MAAIISFFGALFLLQMAIENWNATLPVPASTAQEPNSLAKGILTNLLNPHPYIFWLTIGTPVLLEGSKDHWASPVAFVIGMFLLMIAVKICVALALKNSSKSITPKKYTLILRLSSVMLLWIAGTFAFDALPVLRELFQ